MKKYLSTIFLYLFLLIGLSLMLYPSFADWWNSFHQSRAIASYAEQVANIDDDTYEQIWNDACEYNRDLLDRSNQFALTDELLARYAALLNVGGNDIMGYIEIPSIDVALPVYHGTDEAILQVAVGHLEWTSLPVGGEGSHCVLSGHRGLSSARLFTDLDELVEGDIFILRVLDEILTYEVDQILIVEPDVVKDLVIDREEDLCTLVTCTPYGINSHRLLVRGHRIDNLADSQQIRITSDAIQIEPVVVAPFVAAPMLLFLLILILIPKRRRNRP